MAVAIDVRTSGTSTTAATSISWTATVSGGLSNSILLVTCTTGAGTAVNVSGINWDDAGTPEALTQKGSVTEPLANCRAFIWYRLSPTAKTATIKVTAASSCEMTGGSASYQGVDQTTPFNAASPQTSTGVA